MQSDYQSMVLICYELNHEGELDMTTCTCHSHVRTDKYFNRKLTN